MDLELLLSNRKAVLLASKVLGMFVFLVENSGPIMRKCEPRKAAGVPAGTVRHLLFVKPQVTGAAAELTLGNSQTKHSASGREPAAHRQANYNLTNPDSVYNPIFIAHSKPNKVFLILP